MLKKCQSIKRSKTAIKLKLKKKYAANVALTVLCECGEVQSVTFPVEVNALQ